MSGDSQCAALRAVLGIPESVDDEGAILYTKTLQQELVALKCALGRTVNNYEELRAALGIPAEATHEEAVERARRIAYEAETARLIEGIYADVQQWSDGVWQVDTESNGSHLDGNLHLAVRAAAGKGEQS